MDSTLRKEYLDKAFMLHSKNYITEAEHLYNKIINENPEDSEVYNLLGICYLHGNDYKNAEKCTLKAIKINPQKYFFQSLADIYLKQNKFKMELKTRKLQEKLYGLDYELAYNLGISYKNNGNFDCSEKYYKKAIKLSHDPRDAYFNLANMYKLSGNNKLAKKFYNKCLLLNNDDFESMYFLSLILMQEKNYKYGLKNFEARLCRLSAFSTQQKTYPNKIREDNLWNGENIKDKTLYTYYEAGFGDMIMFARYIYKLQKLCKKVIIKPQIELYELFKENFPECEVIKYFKQESEINFDVHIPFLSVPYVLGLTSKNLFVKKNGYIKANTQKISDYKLKYFNNNNFKIGIKWQGNTYYDKGRIIDIKAFLPLLNLENISIYSCQTFDGSDNLKEINLQNKIIDIAKTFNSFSDTAAAIANMNLIISNDSSLAHIAGAMGIPCIILLPYEYNWRWHNNLTKCDWYSSVNLYRLGKNEKWDNLMLKVIRNLKLGK